MPVSSALATCSRRSGHSRGRSRGQRGVGEGQGMAVRMIVPQQLAPPPKRKQEASIWQGLGVSCPMHLGPSLGPSLPAQWLGPSHSRLPSGWLGRLALSAVKSSLPSAAFTALHSAGLLSISCAYPGVSAGAAAGRVQWCANARMQYSLGCGRLAAAAPVAGPERVSAGTGN